MLNKDYAPFIIATLNRYEHLKQLIDSLLQCKEAKCTELVIGLDYPPSEKYVEGYKKVKTYLPSIKGFGKITILDTEVNLGVAANFRRLREYVESEGYDSFISSEDDNIFAPAFLSYMNWALKTFKSDSSVFGICSYREKDDSIPGYPNNFYKANGVRPYGLAIWFDRYKRYQQRIDFDFMKGLVDKMPLRFVFNLEKVRIACKYLYFYDKRIIYGDFCIGQMCVDEHMFCITPVKSLTKNIGSDGSGLHGADLERQKRECSRVLDDAKSFIPVWEEKNLYTPEVIAAEGKVDKEMAKTSIKQIFRHCFNILKFVVYKTTGKIISYKQN